MLLYSRVDIEKLMSNKDEAASRTTFLATDFTKCDVRTATLIAAQVILSPTSSVRLAENTIGDFGAPYDVWMEELESAGKKWHTEVARGWLLKNKNGTIHKIAEYAIFLFNERYGKTKDIFTEFLFSERMPPHDIGMVLTHILHQKLGLSYTDIDESLRGDFSRIAQALNSLFSEESIVIEEWLKDKKGQLCMYGGAIKPIIGAYNKFFSKKVYGVQFLNRSAEARFDLGGGFSTSDFVRLFKTALVSADCISPHVREFDSEFLIQKAENGKVVVACGDEREVYINKQSEIEHLDFDVFKDSFPTNSRSYLIISSNFILGKVHQNYNAGLKGFRDASYVLTSLYGLQRVMELVCLGKDVDVCFIQKIKHDKPYRHKTCVVQWREGGVVRLITTRTKNNKTDFESVMLEKLKVTKTNADFQKYLPV